MSQFVWSISSNEDKGFKTHHPHATGINPSGTVRRRPVKAQRATGARKWEQILIETALGFSRK